jgi:hypothetical protein
VVRGVAAGDLKPEEQKRYGQKVVDHFNTLPSSSYATARSMEDVESGLQVVRTLLKLGHFQWAADAFLGDLAWALVFNLEAHVETLSIVKPFFPMGWACMPMEVDPAKACTLVNVASCALNASGEVKQAIMIQSSTIVHAISNQDLSLVTGQFWLRQHIQNLGFCLLRHGQLAAAWRLLDIHHDIVTMLKFVDDGDIFLNLLRR